MLGYRWFMSNTKQKMTSAKLIKTYSKHKSFTIMHGIRKSNRGAMYPVLVFGAFEADGYGIIGEEVRYESVVRRGNGGVGVIEIKGRINVLNGSISVMGTVPKDTKMEVWRFA